MKIAIMGAMPEEVKLIKHFIDITDTVEKGSRTYYIGKMGHHDITLVFSRWGKVAASSTATTLINLFGAELILFTGVAGAVDPSLNVGDVVVGEGLYQHDMDARPIFKRFQIPLTEHTVFKPASQYVQKARDAATTYLADTTAPIAQPTLTKFSIFQPKVVSGIIATGDRFVANPQSHDALKLDDDQKVLAVEMEGAAVAQICQEYETPFVVIRTISDKADHSASVDFQAFVAEVASHYSAGITKAFLGSI